MAANASATPFTSISPSGLNVTSVGASTVGGVVVDLFGLNNAHAVSQLAASTLFSGYSPNPVSIGTQTGFGVGVTGALGGGLQSASIRFSLDDGDSAAGNFDGGSDLMLVINGINIAIWSTVQAENTTSLGNATAQGFSGGGFRNNLLDTGWFHITDAGKLSSLFTSLINTEKMVFEIQDVDPDDNFYDFTQGIDNSLINVGQGPGVIPGNGVPEPASLALLGIGLAGLGAMRRRKTA